MTNNDFRRPANKNDIFEGCPITIETRGQEKGNGPRDSSRAKKGEFEIVPGPTITIPAGNVICTRDDEGNVSYSIGEKDTEKEI